MSENEEANSSAFIIIIAALFIMITIIGIGGISQGNSSAKTTTTK